MSPRVACPAAALVALALLTSCGEDASSGAEEGGTTLTVYAAASLTATFEQVADEFENQHDGVNVELVLGGSSDLVAQIQEGAPADVFASADTANMDKLAGEDLQAADPQDFAANTLEIAVPPGNPAGIASFADLAQDGLNLVICAPEVPCGAAAVKVEEEAGVDLQPVSEEPSVTDVIAARGDVEGISFPESAEAGNTYPIVALQDAADGDLAQAFVDLVLGDTGQQILQDAGFTPADAASVVEP